MILEIEVPPIIMRLMSAVMMQSILALLSATTGALLAISLGVSHRNLCALISFAAGTLLATTFIHIVPEAWGSISWIGITLALASGYLVFFGVSRYVFHVCPACAASHFDEQTASEFKTIALMLAIALGIHSAMDGLALAVGGKLQASAERSIFITVVIHKLPEGLALCALLLKAGYQKIKSLLLTLAFESSTLVGSILGMVLLKNFETGAWFYWTLLHIGGGFLYLAFHAVLNESREHSPRFILFFFLVGVVLISLTHWLPT